MGSSVIVIGGGPHGLAVLAALAARPEPWPAAVTVVDPHEGWATAWDDKLARLSLDRLRSPQVHHPGPRPMELRDLVEALADDEQEHLRRPEEERVPTPAGMRALIDVVAGGLGPIRWVRGRARSMQLQPSDGDAGQVEVVLDDARRFTAATVVLAHNPSVPRIPDWARELIDASRAVHASEVDLRVEPLEHRYVAIVGGGLTAGSLACEVIHRGGRATILSRRPLRERPYDVDAGWLGPRHLERFLGASMEERRRLIDEARDGGTMPPRVLADLRSMAAAGTQLALRESVHVEAELAHLLAGEDRPDTVWLATGFENDVQADPLVAPLVARLGVPVLGGLPALTDDLRLPGTPVFVIGPYAALGVGPAARNLAGARPAAARIAAAIAAPVRPAAKH